MSDPGRGQERRFELGATAYLVTALVAPVLVCWMTNAELRMQGLTPTASFWLEPGPMAAANVIRQLTRAVITILALAVTVTGIAVPLTASLYTPRLLELFVRDRLTVLYFVYLTFTALLTHFVLYVIRDVPQDVFVPNALAIWAALMGQVCIVVTGPFLLHMFGFLSPRNIVRRMAAEVTTLLERAPREDSDALRFEVSEGIAQFTELVARAITRHDSQMIGAVIDQLGKLATSYRNLKPRMPESWFAGDPSARLTTPKRTIKVLKAEGTWFEFKLLQVIDETLPGIMSETPEVTIRAARMVRQIASRSAATGDTEVVALAIRFLNTFLRQAITEHRVRAFYYISWEYRRLAEDLADVGPDQVPEIARLLAFYGQAAADAGMAFAYHVAIYDIADILLVARTANLSCVPAVAALLVHHLRRDTAPLEPAAKVIGHALAAAQDDLADEIAAVLAELPPDRVGQAVEHVLEARQPYYQEVTARVSDLNHVPDEARTALETWWQQAGDGH